MRMPGTGKVPKRRVEIDRVTDQETSSDVVFRVAREAGGGRRISNRRHVHISTCRNGWIEAGVVLDSLYRISKIEGRQIGR